MNRAQERKAWEEHITGQKVKVGKFGNKKVTDASGRKFDSKRERKRAGELELLLKLGKISDLQYQIRFEVIPKQDGMRAAHYVADFGYVENGQVIIEDAKGMKTPVYILKKKLMLQVHGIAVREV